MNPIIAASLISSGSALLSRAVGPAAPAGPSISGSSQVSSGGSLDFSGFTVSTGGNGGTSNAQASLQKSQSLPIDMNTLILYAVVAVVAIRIWGK
jgi:hypothetical protein